MTVRTIGDPRRDALTRAAAHSPFLGKALQVREDIADAFLADGAEQAAELALAAHDGALEHTLRRQRYGLALATALGDLAGELPLERVTRLLSDFADSAIDGAVAVAIAERV